MKLFRRAQVAANNNSARSVSPRSRTAPFAPVIALFGFIALAALVAWLAIVLLRRLPQRTVVMAVYPEGSLNAELAIRYQQALARDGVDLKLSPSAGAVEAIARLRDPKSATCVALIPGGLTNEQESPELESLGTLFYQPLWIFTRGHSLQRHGHVRGLRMSVGPEGSSSRALSLELLGHAGIIEKKLDTLLAFTPSESAGCPVLRLAQRGVGRGLLPRQNLNNGIRLPHSIKRRNLEWVFSRQPHTHEPPSPLPRSGCSLVLRAACREGGIGVSPVRSEPPRRAQCWVTSERFPIPLCRRPARSHRRSAQNELAGGPHIPWPIFACLWQMCGLCQN